ncbi:ABC transporter ATP-binding protein [Streptomyces sp. NPDC004042]|uniref:ABC transporter ATP-binding protein n=1 Tax=Streptomyces sp. NPDC004042 TaxID=3154451 RepID=UPI0033B90E3B
MSKRYGRGHWILRDVDVEAPAGEVVAFAGGNGSGKSTLLRIAAGLSRPTLGTVAARPPVVGYVPHRFSPDERMSAMAYLTHMGRVRGLTTSVASARAGRLLDRLALVGGGHAPPLRSLSKGNAQKVALAQALLVEPGLLVLDEPWSGLDSDAHGVLAEIMTEVAAAGGTVVFTDHRESVTRARATRTYTVGAGRVSPRGPEPSSAEQRPASDVVLVAGRDGRVPQDLVLMVLGLFFPLWMGDYTVTPADLLLGLEAQLTCALVGIAIGVLCSRAVFGRRGHALVAALALTTGALFTRGMPPVNRLFTLMSTTPDAAGLLAPAGVMLALSAVILAVSTAVTQFVAGRRE